MEGSTAYFIQKKHSKHSDDAYATFYEAQQNSFWSLYISFTWLILTLVKKHVTHMKNTKKDRKIRLNLEAKGSSTTWVVNFYYEHVCCPSVHERQLEQKAEDQQRNSRVRAGGLLCVKPDSVSEPLRTSSIELVHLVTITVESKCGCVANILSCLWALVDISIDEQCICMIIAQVTKCWQHFSTCMAPDRYKQKDLSEVQPIIFAHHAWWAPPVNVKYPFQHTLYIQNIDTQMTTEWSCKSVNSSALSRACSVWLCVLWP